MGTSITSKDDMEKVCIVCEQSKQEGIHIFGRFLCLDCEKAMVQTDTADPKYRFYVKQLKKIISSEIYS
ncbi:MULTISPECIES: sigma factor G inhibitor Gin [Parageobacillus]|uniref:sigma factor G inhibitor Gin n=1 Tax=Anoxybacillaceae TaxID=3120669 RepID=UPI0002D6E5DF|nr:MULTISPECIES: sigma factor G inhibitor Gin [Parageobacillus]